MKKKIQQGNWLHHNVPLILSTPKSGYFLFSKFDPLSRIICEDLTALPAGKKYRLTLQIIADICMLSDFLLHEEECELRYLSNISQSHWSCSTRGRADIEGRLSFRSNMSSSYGSLSINTTTNNRNNLRASIESSQWIIKVFSFDNIFANLTLVMFLRTVNLKWTKSHSLPFHYICWQYVE